MKNFDIDSNQEFDNQKQLLLQQLQTLKEISVFKSQKDDSEAKDSNEVKQFEDLEVEKWQLVPPDIKLYDWQRECLEIWRKDNRGTVKVATGGGKTLLAMAAAQDVQNNVNQNLKLVVVVPSVPLMNQWYDEFKNSNLPLSQIGLLSGKNKVTPDQNLKVIITVIQFACKNLPDVIKSLGWGDNLLMVVDECHRANARVFRRIFETKTKYTLGLSATPESDADSEGIIEDSEFANSPVGKALGPIIYDFSLEDCLKAGLLTEFDIWHVALPLRGKEITKYNNMSREISELHKQLTNRYTNTKSRSKQSFIAWCNFLANKRDAEASRFMGLSNDRKRMLYRSTARAEFVQNILTASIADPDRMVILFHEKIDEINMLYRHALNTKLPVVLEHSKLSSKLRDENIEAFRIKLAKIIISARSLVEGFNVPSADIGIIAASSSSLRQRIQSLGRMLRKKESGEKALIFVLYMKETTDESIYQKADWERIIGADRNWYFEWKPNEAIEKSPDRLDIESLQLVKLDGPPKEFRPSSNSIDSSSLNFGDEYKGATNGISVRVDKEMNLRTQDEVLIKVSAKILNKICELNSGKYATITPSGHLICRMSSDSNQNNNWFYMADVKIPKAKKEHSVEKLSIKSFKGKRRITRTNKNEIIFALDSNLATDKKAGKLTENLLSWIIELEKRNNTKIYTIYWNKGEKYWVEVGGSKHQYSGASCQLEFPK